MKLDRSALAYIIVVIVASVSIGVLTATLIHENHKIDRARVEQCIAGRVLIQQAILISTGFTLDQWNQNPAKVTAAIRDKTIHQYLDLGLNPYTAPAQKRINESVDTLHRTMDLASPDSCHTVT